MILFNQVKFNFGLLAFRLLIRALCVAWLRPTAQRRIFMRPSRALSRQKSYLDDDKRNKLYLVNARAFIKNGLKIIICARARPLSWLSLNYFERFENTSQILSNGKYWPSLSRGNIS
ncbi:hypothetical protein BpHYR1_007458 [Brachionus plicatilis]|uniref:Uncharacterized protein n=1 Tax=Brachionus plicatilis TaxID=10195 RepID=A0A3M7Q6P0_BRAPC|nr:hypothetical protein BpHYR1_007458 [Brachionus plicatilis]